MMSKRARLIFQYFSYKIDVICHYLIGIPYFFQEGFKIIKCNFGGYSMGWDANGKTYTTLPAWKKYGDRMKNSACYKFGKTMDDEEKIIKLADLSLHQYLQTFSVARKNKNKQYPLQPSEQQMIIQYSGLWGSPNPKNPKYIEWCKASLAKFKPWTGNIRNAWNNETDSQKIIDLWQRYASSEFGKQKIPTYVQQDVEKYMNIIQLSQEALLNEGETEDVDSYEENESLWQVISRLGLSELSEELEKTDEADWTADSVYLKQKYGENFVSSLKDFIKNQRKEKQVRLNFSPTDPKALKGKQKLAYDILKKRYDGNNKKGFGMIISGTGGSGKSFTINAVRTIYKDEQRQCKVTATTGSAAFGIGGYTLHSVLQLPVGKKKRHDLKNDSLKLLQEELENVETIIIDEMSMLGLDTLRWVDKRLRQAKNRLTEPFGGLNVILVGDFGQLPPVCDMHMWLKPTENTKKKNKRYLTWQLYRNFFTRCVNLETSRRQRDDDVESKKFRDILHRMRDGKCNRNDFNFLKKYFVNDENDATLNQGFFQDALRLFPDNDSRCLYNVKKIKEIKQPQLVLKAEHNHKQGNGKKKDFFEGLDGKILIKKGARIMITNNLWCEAGIVNGSTGVVKYIVYEGENEPPKLPNYIIVQLDKYNGPSCLPDEPNCVPLAPLTKNGDVSENGVSLTRTQYPLRLCYAITIHKSQGMSLDKCVINLQGNKKRVEKDCAKTFVAFSRVKDITKARIIAFDYEKLVKDGKSRHLNDRLNEEKRLEKIAKKTEKEYMDSVATNEVDNYNDMDVDMDMDMDMNGDM